MASQWLAYTVEDHSCWTAAAAAVGCVMHLTACALNKTSHSIMSAIYQTFKPIT